MDPSLQAAMTRANDAIKQHDCAAARAALEEALAYMAASRTENTSLSVLMPLQAAFMSWRAGDMQLAQRFAARALPEAARELEEVCGDYKRDLDERNPRGAATCRRAANYVVAFVPFVQRHPWVSWDRFDLTDVDEQSNALAVAIVRNIRPVLDTLGWASWPYPPEVERAARYWSARALTDWGRLRIGNIASGGDVEAAHALAESALSLLEDLPEDQLTADALHLLGHAFVSYGDYSLIRKEAIPRFLESIRILDAVGNHDDAAVDRGDLGALLIGQAALAEANGGAAEAERLYTQAEEQLQSAVAVHRTCRFPEHLLGALLNLGSLQMARQKYSQAEAAYRDVLDAAGTDPAPTPSTAAPLILALANLGSAQLEQGRAAEAEENFRRAVSLIQAPGTPPVEPEAFALAYGGLGDALRRQAKPEEAERYLFQATGRLETFAFSFFSERSKGSFVKRFRGIYESLIDCYASLATGQPERGAAAFNLVERMKWRSLTQTLRYIPLRFPGLESEPLVEEETALLSQIFGAAIGTIGGPRNIDTEAILRRLEEIWTELEPRYPEYVAIRREKTVEAQDAVAWLDDQVPTLVEYYLGDDHGTALAVVLNKGRKWPVVVRLPCSPSEIAVQVAALRPKQGRDFPSSEAFKAASQALHRSLIVPVLPFLPENSGVCFVPFGVLHNLPFAALFDGRQYFIERHPVVVAPTATGLRWWRRHKASGSANSCLIVAVSTRSGVGQDLNDFKKLAHDEIQGLFSGAVFVPSQEATKARLRAELAGAGGTQWDVVHIACHGNFQEEGLSSYLEMQPAPDGGDFRWTASEILTEIRTSASLVTLSACDSGIAETSTNDEIAGLAQAFLFGGASSVLASVWRVQQGVGVEITRDFYELWMGVSADRPACSKIDALRIAIQARLGEKTWSGFSRKPLSPYLWAAFQLYGDWR